MGTFTGHIVEMRCLAAHDGSQADNGRILPGLRQQFGRQRQLERARHALDGDAIGTDAMILQPPDAPGQEFIDDFLVEARGRDGDAGITRNIARIKGRRLRAHVNESRTRSPHDQCAALRVAAERVVGRVVGRVAGLGRTNVSETFSRARVTPWMVVSLPPTSTMARVRSNLVTSTLTSRLLVPFSKKIQDTLDL